MNNNLPQNILATLLQKTVLKGNNLIILNLELNPSKPKT